MAKLKELIHIMRQHSTVTFTLHGLGESIFECSYFDKVVEEFDQLEADAELGCAVRLWFSKGGIIERSRVEIWNESELIEWAKGVNQC
jgi:hypothetical protein